MVLLADVPGSRPRHVLTVGDGLHAEAQQCVQEVHNVIEGVFVDVLAHRLAKLDPVQLVQAGQAVLSLRDGRTGGGHPASGSDPRRETRIFEPDLHPEAVSGEAAVALAAAVGASQRLDDLDEHGEGQAVGAEAGALFLPAQMTDVLGAPRL